MVQKTLVKTMYLPEIYSNTVLASSKIQTVKGTGITCHSLLSLGTCERTCLHFMKNTREGEKKTRFMIMHWFIHYIMVYSSLPKDKKYQLILLKYSTVNISKLRTCYQQDYMQNHAF